MALVILKGVAWIAAKFTGMRRLEIMSGVNSSWRPAAIASLIRQLMVELLPVEARIISLPLEVC